MPEPSQVSTIAAQMGVASDIASIVQSIVLAAAAIATVVIAAKGLSTWRTQLRGTSEYAKAKQVLKAVYKVRRGFSAVRNPAIYQYEYPPGMTDHTGHLSKEHEYEGTAHVYQARWDVLAEAFTELEEETLDAVVEWGADFQQVIVPLRRCMVELQIEIQNELERKKEPQFAEPLTKEERAHHRSVMYEIGSDSKYDAFTPQIDAAVSVFEDKLRPFVEK